LLENAVVDFSRIEIAPLKGRKDSTASTRVLKDGFIRSPTCDGSMVSGGLAPITTSKDKRCDAELNETLILLSHDEIGIAEANFGHHLNDVMNLWVSLWLSGTARSAKSTVSMLNVDALRTLAFLQDSNHSFFATYNQNIKSVIRGVDLGRGSVCAKRLFVPAKTPLLFVWEGYTSFESPCSFLGPSSLFQRWNFHVRDGYGLLPSAEAPIKQALKVLLVVRKIENNLWGSNRSSRNFLNTDDIIAALQKLVDKSNSQRPRRSSKLTLVVQDLAALSFPAQVALMGDVGLVVGMHGAGIPHSMHMPIGSQFCCGVVELFPKGEHSAIKYHGNMVRKMGIRYSRIDIEEASSRDTGAIVPIAELTKTVGDMLLKLQTEPTCVLPHVLADPYFEKALLP